MRCRFPRKKIISTKCLGLRTGSRQSRPCRLGTRLRMRRKGILFRDPLREPVKNRRHPRRVRLRRLRRVHRLHRAIHSIRRNSILGLSSLTPLLLRGVSLPSSLLGNSRLGSSACLGVTACKTKTAARECEAEMRSQAAALGNEGCPSRFARQGVYFWLRDTGCTVTPLPDVGATAFVTGTA